MAIVSSTRIEWVYADLAVMCAGGATTTVYPATARGGGGLHPRPTAARGSSSPRTTPRSPSCASSATTCPTSVRVVTFDGTADGEWVIDLDDLRGARRPAPGGAPDGGRRGGRRRAARAPRHADLHLRDHRPAQGRRAAAPVLDLHRRRRRRRSTSCSPDDLQYLWLPLSHVLRQDAARRCSCRSASPRPSTAASTRSSTTSPWSGPPSWPARRASSRRCTRRSCRPSRRRAASGTGCSPGPSASATRSRAPGCEHVAPAARAGAARRWPTGWCSPRSAHRLGGRIRFLVSGSAALSPDIAHWFHAAGMLILEGYALTETSCGRLHRPGSTTWQFGVVGPPMPGTEIRIAEDGEIFIRGPGVMRGYHHLPEVTAEVLDADGWFATGDVGEIDDDGPAAHHRPQEGPDQDLRRQVHRARRPSRCCSRRSARWPAQMLVHAEGRNYATALITLDPEALDQWATGPGPARRPTTRRSPRTRPCVTYVGWLRRGAQRPAQPLGDDQGLPDPRPRPHRRRRRADPEPEGPAQGHRVAVPAAARLDVRRPAAWMTADARWRPDDVAAARRHPGVRRTAGARQPRGAAAGVRAAVRRDPLRPVPGRGPRAHATPCSTSSSTTWTGSTTSRWCCW